MAFPLALRRHIGSIVLAIGIAIALSDVCAFAQGVDEFQFKAAFMFNVPKFVEWPAAAFAAPTDPVVACIFGDTRVDAALAQAPSTPVVDNRKLVFRRLKDVKQVQGCHILFVSASEQKRWRWSAVDLGTTGVLTIGEAEGFAAAGGVVDFKVQDTKVKIEVNLDAADRAGLRISSKLLRLSTIVKN